MHDASGDGRSDSAENAAEIWSRALSRLSGMVVEQARQFDSVAFPAPNRLVIRFKPGYAFFKSGLRAARAGCPVRAGAWPK